MLETPSLEMSSQNINIWTYNLKIKYNNIDISNTFSYTCTIKKLYTYKNCRASNIQERTFFHSQTGSYTTVYARTLYIMF